MLRQIIALALALAAYLAPASAAAQSPKLIAVESYYRLKWGQGDDFRSLYSKNHAPLLAKMQQQGFIVRVKTDVPETHMAGGERWDFRVSITYSDARHALGDAELSKAWAAVREEMRRTNVNFDIEERQRWSMVEEHWDVIVNELR